MTMEASNNDQQAASSPILRLMSALRDKRRKRACATMSVPSENPLDFENLPPLARDSDLEEEMDELEDLAQMRRLPVGRRSSAPSYSTSALPTTLSCPAKLEVIISGGKVITRRRPSTVSSCPVTPRKSSTTSDDAIDTAEPPRTRSRKAATSVTPQRSVHSRISEEAKMEEKRSRSLTELSETPRITPSGRQVGVDTTSSPKALERALPLRRSKKFTSLPTSSTEAQLADGRYILPSSQRPDCSIKFPLRCTAIPVQSNRQLSVC